MLRFYPIPAFSDNYIWALVNPSNKQAVIIDPGQADPVRDYINQHGLDLTAIWITHKHADHIGGVSELRELYPLTHVVAHADHGIHPDQEVKEGTTINLWGKTAQVWLVAGHTQHHLAYVMEVDKVKHVFCGDTLFSAGCGRVFTGTVGDLYHSLERFAKLPDDTLFYPAHEYTLNNLAFGLSIEPNNMAMKHHVNEIEQRLANNQTSLPTSLSQERDINVFLRCDKDSVVSAVAQQVELDDDKPLTVFAALRQLKDDF